MVALRAVNERFALAKGEKPGTNEAVVEQPVDALLQRGAEVDEHVGAQDEVEVVEGGLRDEVVSRPDDTGLELTIEPSAAAGDRVVVRKVPAPARPLVALLAAANLVEGVRPCAGDRQGVLV